MTAPCPTCDDTGTVTRNWVESNPTRWTSVEVPCPDRDRHGGQR